MSDAISFEPGAARTAGTNFGLKDEIRAYWGKRAETFDLSYGRRIRSPRAVLFQHLSKPIDRLTRCAAALGAVIRATGFEQPRTSAPAGIKRRQFASASCDHTSILSARKPVHDGRNAGAAS
jgi:hypothetical protein